MNLDFLILNFIQSHFHNGFTDFFFPAVTVLGNAGFIWVVAGMCLICSKKYRPYGVMLLAALMLTHTVGEGILKPIFARPRPFSVTFGYRLLIAAPHGYSFPSGHAGSSFAAAFILRRANRKFTAPSFSLALLIAVSRVFLFVHYPSDVFAGAILGVLCACLICWLYKRI